MNFYGIFECFSHSDITYLSDKIIYSDREGRSHHVASYGPLEFIRDRHGRLLNRGMRMSLKEQFDKEKGTLLETERKLKFMGKLMLFLSLVGLMISLILHTWIGLIMMIFTWGIYVLTLSSRLVIGSQIDTMEFIIENSDCNCASKVVIEDKEE